MTSAIILAINGAIDVAINLINFYNALPTTPEDEKIALEKKKVDLLNTKEEVAKLPIRQV